MFRASRTGHGRNQTGFAVSFGGALMPTWRFGSCEARLRLGDPSSPRVPLCEVLPMGTLAEAEQICNGSSCQSSSLLLNHAQIQVISKDPAANTGYILSFTSRTRHVPSGRQHCETQPKPRSWLKPEQRQRFNFHKPAHNCSAQLQLLRNCRA